MTLTDRVLIILRGARQTLSAPQIAAILGTDAQRVARPLFKLQTSGAVERVGSEKDGLGRMRGLYRFSEQ